MLGKSAVALGTALALSLALPTAGADRLAPAESTTMRSEQELGFVSAMGIDTGRWGLAYGRDLYVANAKRGLSLGLEAGGAFALVSTTAEPKTSWRGAAAWSGPVLAYRVERKTAGNRLGFRAQLLLAPLITALEQSAGLVSIAARPSLRMRYNWFAFSLGLNLEVPVGHTEVGPYQDEERPALLPGAHLAFGVVF